MRSRYSSAVGMGSGLEAIVIAGLVEDRGNLALDVSHVVAVERPAVAPFEIVAEDDGGAVPAIVRFDRLDRDVHRDAAGLEGHEVPLAPGQDIARVGLPLVDVEFPHRSPLTPPPRARLRSSP